MKKLLLLVLITLFSMNVIFAADNINWYSIDDGFELSKETGKPILLLLYSQQYPSEMIFTEISTVSVVNNKYIPIKIDYSQEDLKKQLKEKIQGYHYSSDSYINIIDCKNNVIAGYGFRKDRVVDQEKFLEFLNENSQLCDQSVIEKNLGKVTIAEFNSYFNNLEKQKTVKIEAKIESMTIRQITGGQGGHYFLILDDGTSGLSTTYDGGVGNLNSGDMVDAELIVEGLTPLAKPKIIKISKSDNSLPQNIPNSIDDESINNTSGFGLIAGVVALLYIWRKIS